MHKENTSEPIMTVPDEINSAEAFYLTGNEYLALPQIDTAGGITSLNVLRLDQNGLLEFSGSENMPLLTPTLTINDLPVDLSKNPLTWRYLLDWLPSFSLESSSGYSIEGEIVAPPGHKGFIYRLRLHNNSSVAITAKIGWQGLWTSFNFLVFNKREVDGKNSLSYNRWTKSLVLEASAGLPLAALALAVEPETEWNFDQESKFFSTDHYTEIKANESFAITLFAAVNLEADGAATTTVDLRRHGEETLKNLACSWLESRRVKLDKSALSSLLNKNLFFCYFYSLARSLDSETLVAVTSRSPRYYVSAAFWSRDALLWSFPAIMIADQTSAREMLLNIYQRHIRNAGDHAHYISGTVLYPGFELDQLAAYYIALQHYLEQSGDYSMIKEDLILKGLDLLTEKVFEHFDPESGLYNTFLDPSDDPVSFPYLTYNNALLQCAFNFLAGLQQDELWYHKSDFAILARELQQAIYDHCTVKGPCGQMFTWAVDGKGRFTLYDNPPGSLQLLAHYRFCSLSDTIYKNTVRWIRSANNNYFHQGRRFEEAGSRHSTNPWPLAACNDLLACNSGALDFLARTEMDDGFFCETVNPDTGQLSTGAAFASAAGFLAYALKVSDVIDNCQDKELNENGED
jgi:uncharacterized protein